MAKKGAADDVPWNANLRANFEISCKTLKVQPVPASINAALSPEADPEGPIATLVVKEPVGSQAIVALCAAILGRGAKMQPTMYKHLRNVSMLTAQAGDAGGAAVAELVKHGKAVMPLESVTMTDCGVGPQACRAFGESLMLGANVTLQTLALDLNPIGDEGVALLCRGLATNRMLKKLSLAYCGLGLDSVKSLEEVITSPLPTLEIIELAGNTGLGSQAVLSLTQAAKKSTVLKELGFKDCGIGSVNGNGEMVMIERPASAEAGATGVEDSGESEEADAAMDGGLGTGLTLVPVSVTIAALRSLGEALSSPSCGLCRSTLEMNPITSQEAAVLLEYLGPQAGNTKCEAMRVDLTLRPPSLFAGLLRVPVVKKGKKKK